MKPRRPPQRPAKPTRHAANNVRTANNTRTPGPAPSSNVEIVSGLRAALAVYSTRAQDIVRIAYTAQTKPDIAALLSFASSHRVEHGQLSDADLSRFADSPQHDGVCLETKPRTWTTPKALVEHLVKTKGVAIAFDRVRNPYNIGAVLRSAAFFGIDAAIFGMPAPHPALSSQAVRVAEGGAEHLRLSRTTDLADTLTRVRDQGIAIFGAEDDGSHNAIGYAFKRPCVLVLGHEREGISPKVRALCDAMVAIPGGGSVHSLNVSIAASVLITEIQRGTLASTALKPSASAATALKLSLIHI